MKTLEVIGYNRANLGKKESSDLRLEGNVPCVLYGGGQQVHFYAPMIQFRDIIYTSEACFVELNVEGKKTRAVLKEAQYHPVSETLLHIDFLELNDKKAIKMEIPVKVSGTSPGVLKGGRLAIKLSRLSLQALPNEMPDFIPVDISTLELGKSIRVSQVVPEGTKCFNAPSLPVCSIAATRASKQAGVAEVAGKK